MSGILVTYRGVPAALLGARQLSFLGEVRHLPPGHPTVRMVTYMAYYAQLVLGRQMPCQYTDEDAARFARLALIDPDQLARRRTDSDRSLAARFAVPVHELSRARQKLGDGR